MFGTTIKRYSPSNDQNLRHELQQSLRRRHEGAIPVRHKCDKHAGLWHKAGRARWIWTTISFRRCGCACIRFSRIYVWRGRSDSVWCIRRCWALSWRTFGVAVRQACVRRTCTCVRRTCVWRLCTCLRHTYTCAFQRLCHFLRRLRTFVRQRTCVRRTCVRRTYSVAVRCSGTCGRLWPTAERGSLRADFCPIAVWPTIFRRRQCFWASWCSEMAANEGHD